MRLTLSIALLLIVTSSLEAQDSPSAADITAHLARLTPTASRDVRLEVAGWLKSSSKSKHAPVAMPALEKLVRTDPDAGVRARAVAALLLIAHAHQKPCPLALVEAVRDPDEDVRVNAAVGLFKEFEPGAVRVLVEGTQHKHPDVRSDCVSLLGTVAPKDPNALAVIEKAKADPHSNVRHTAHCARFAATNDLGEFLAYFIRLREDPASIKDRHPAGSEARKLEDARYSLYQIGSAMRLVEWTNQRPDELAAALMKLLGDKSPVMRRGAATVIGAAARKVELKRADPLAPLEAGKDLPGSIWPFLDPGTARKDDPPEPSPAALRLRALKVEERLRALWDKDPDESVRTAAFIALERLAAVPVKKK